MIAIIIVVGALIFISQAANGICDTLLFHFDRSPFARLNPLYWNPRESWRNKYKNGDPKQGPRFFLSTTALVAFTDAWHLFDMLSRTAWQLALALTPVLLIEVWPWWVTVVVLAAQKLVGSAGFHLTYTLMSRRSTALAARGVGEWFDPRNI